eukprot:4875554-Amphidinium_carterae.1
MAMKELCSMRSNSCPIAMWSATEFRKQENTGNVGLVPLCPLAHLPAHCSCLHPPAHAPDARIENR